MKEMMANWRHVFKLDPDRSVSDDSLDALCTSGTDGIIVGGTTGVTFENTMDLLSRLRRYPISTILEISNAESVVPGFDGYLIPIVLNAQNPDWIFTPHLDALNQYGAIINWDQVMVEGYVVLNEKSTVAQLTHAKTNLSTEECVAFARLSDQLLRIPIFYIEYSGTYGDVRLVKNIREKLIHSKLIYGGGIRTTNQAKEMAQYADTIVVGNVIYDDIESALLTVSATKEGT